jgi:hypothetical protein
VSRWSLLGAWVLVAVFSTGLTWQIVSAADDRVSDRPIAPLEVSVPLETAAASGTTTAASGPGVSSVSDTSTTTASSPTTTATAPTAIPTSATSTTSGDQWQTKSVPSAGGTIVVSYRPGEALLQSATPAPGFKAEIEKSGPPKVEVEFESESTRVEIRVEWRDGHLDVEISGPEED